EGNRRIIACLDERAEALGLKRGLGIADARGMHPQIEIVEAEPEADRRLLAALADWCDRYTPLVAICCEDGLFLDITGCGTFNRHRATRPTSASETPSTSPFQRTRSRSIPAYWSSICSQAAHSSITSATTPW